MEIKKFIEKVQLESIYKKFLKNDIICQLIKLFDGDYIKQNYPCEIKNSLEIALLFYKSYNKEYYKKILDGINSGIIVILNEGKSYMDSKANKAYIRLYGNDGDLYIIVHELAHFIDKNSNPKIVPNDYWFLSETFALYMEKKLESWLNPGKYKDLIMTRKNNRIYFESKMLKAIENELYYENLFKQKGTLEESDIDIKKVESIMRYDVPYNIVNFLLQYPIANILSTILVRDNLVENDKDLVSICLSLDLYEALRDMNQKVNK